MKIEIRPLKKEDLSALIKIDSDITGRKRDEYFYKKINDIFTPGKLSCSLVAVADDVVVGFLIGQVFEGEFGIPGDIAYIDTLGIAPKYHKLGIASRLMEQFLLNMKAANIKKIYTLVNFSDTRLINFFSGMGFTPSKRLNLELEMY